jgi:lipid-binding SYLF domain-containing protein
MLHHLRFITTSLLTILLIGSVSAGWDPNEGKTLETEAIETLRQFQEKDPGLQDFFREAKGWAVFPTVGKLGYWLGGAYGKGVLYQADKATGYVELKQVSVGLQFGGQSYSQVIFFKDEASIERFKSDQLEFDAQVSGVIADKGAAAKVDYHDGVAVFTLPKGGLMAEASVGGQAFAFRDK